MPVQAHVQADGCARLAGSGLDKITHLVDEPQAVAAQQLIGRGPVPGERIGEVASVGHLAPIRATSVKRAYGPGPVTTRAVGLG